MLTAKETVSALQRGYAGKLWSYTEPDGLTWLDDGVAPTEEALAAILVQPVIPQVVSRFQAMAALLASGHLAAVEAFMNGTLASPLAKLAWDTAQEFRRFSPLVAGMGAMLGLTAEDLDNLFINAATIVA